MDILKIIIELSFLLVLIVIVKQDFSERKISALLVLASGLLSYFINLASKNNSFVLHQFLLNLIFVLFQIAFLAFYFKIRHPQSQLIDNYIGLGDILFILSLTPLLPFVPFVFLYIFSLVLAIIYYLFKKGSGNSNSEFEIPLAGILAISVPFVFLASASKIFSIPFLLTYF